ncbi:MAG: PRTRC system ParB family protein [Gammaproteobacteria bacterium]|nr:MAG: PRTRC system ParB family protein [Gammaproteobacteria bacterium]
MSAQLKPVEDGQLIYLSPREIDVQPGFNPRSYFDPKALDELIESIRANGIQQNLVVRPAPEPGRYLLIAGERRLRAAKAIGLEEVPCLVRHVDQRQALAIAALENEKRQNISPAEEAQQARRMLDACDGDRDEAARVLGWSRSKLDARLLLLHAHEDVLKALAERRIKLGIAELLSGLPKTAQEKNLPIIIEKGYSVAEVRGKLESMAQKLATAIFDTSGCAGCPHNTTTQASLFDDGMSEGQCVGRSCFSEKTQAALKAKQTELQHQYNAVFLDIEKTAGSWVYLLPDGEAGVGKAQYNACKGCANFGALLSSEPGCEGTVKENVCFDPLCNAEKVKAAQAEAKQAQQVKVSGAKATTSKAKGKPKDKTTAAAPKKVRELSVAFLREQAGMAAEQDAQLRRVLALIGLCSMATFHPKGVPNIPAQAIPALYALDDEALTALEKAVAAHYLAQHKAAYGDSDRIEQAAFAALATAQVDLTGRFTLTREFLEAHTKAGIEALMHEATDPSGQTFAQWWSAKRGPFKKLMGKKSSEIIEAILKADFDFSQWVPSCISGEVDKLKAQVEKHATKESDDA